MKAVGIVVEYNPFHNGHHYHLQQAKKVSRADVVIAVMSGYFLQRGEPALAGKWTRAEMALYGGADLVIELPYAFATQKAELFASGAVSLLQALDADAICFGSEAGEIEPFYELIAFLDQNDEAFNEAVKKQVQKGLSYPKATSLAFQSLNKENLLDLSRPNNILGFHYVKAISEQKARMEAITIKRTKSGYHDRAPASPSIASATSIRNEIESKQSLEAVKNLVPPSSYRLLHKERSEFGKLVDWEDYFPLLKYRLLTASPEELRTIYEIEEGIEHRLIDCVKDSENFHSFIRKVKSKRYTWTRLQRMCTHVLTNTKKTEIAAVLRTKKASYLRLLAMSQAGRCYLNKQKKSICLPIVATRSRHDNLSLRLDERAANTYALAYDASLQQKVMKKEYATVPIQKSDARNQI